jgi:hypothetical protein
VPKDLPDAAVGLPYLYAFCDPLPSSLNDSCGGTNRTDNPAGGRPPYSFQFNSSAGTAPLGARLTPNGVLWGTFPNVERAAFAVCAVDSVGTRVCRTTRLSVVEVYNLTVRFNGTEMGSVRADQDLVVPALCGPFVDGVRECRSEHRRGESVTLTAEPGEGEAFVGWSGPCAGNGTCTLLLDRDREVTAHFEPLEKTVLRIRIAGNGTGAVLWDRGLWRECDSGPAGTRLCAMVQMRGVTVQLQAIAKGNSTFAGWSGACAGTERCSVRMAGDRNVTAHFDSPAG